MVKLIFLAVGVALAIYAWKCLWHKRPSAEVERLLRQVEDVHRSSRIFPEEDFSGPCEWIDREAERLGVIGLVSSHRERIRHQIEEKESGCRP